VEQEDRVAAANAEKDEGNRRYAEGKYGEAVAHYTQALRLAPARHPACAVFYSNRAACHLAQVCALSLSLSLLSTHRTHARTQRTTWHGAGS
jgi:tetratricopeptide (TPR) repeat protein